MDGQVMLHDAADSRFWGSCTATIGNPTNGSQGPQVTMPLPSANARFVSRRVKSRLSAVGPVSAGPLHASIPAVQLSLAISRKPTIHMV
tara:strand:- start:3073 stop:3339 length:267 start_codon:yes stop_codon:yes gene_type:complete